MMRWAATERQIQSVIGLPRTTATALGFHDSTRKRIEKNVMTHKALAISSAARLCPVANLGGGDGRSWGHPVGLREAHVPQAETTRSVLLRSSPPPPHLPLRASLEGPPLRLHLHPDLIDTQPDRFVLFEGLAAFLRCTFGSSEECECHSLLGVHVT